MNAQTTPVDDSLYLVIDTVLMQGVYRTSLDGDAVIPVEAGLSYGTGQPAIRVAGEFEMSLDQADELALALQRQVAVARHSFRNTQ